MIIEEILADFFIRIGLEHLQKMSSCPEKKLLWRKKNPAFISSGPFGSLGKKWKSKLDKLED